MKKLFTPILIFLFVLEGFAQTGNVTVEQILEINNGTEMFDKLVSSALPNIAPEKQDDFKQKANTLIQNKKNEAVAYFQKKYTQKDLNDIYQELSQPDLMSYSEKTTVFLKEWRIYKTKFQTEFKQFYYSYQ